MTCSGWKPLVRVICNTLTGYFLGGHDKDLYILCTGGVYTGLPLQDVKQGGCVMTCAQFEKRAGRELSKKWKERWGSAGCVGYLGYFSDVISCPEWMPPTA